MSRLFYEVNMTYQEKLKDPRWQKKRLEILERDNFTCQICYDTEKTLHVHHRWYEKNREPWDYPNDVYTTLCENCHNGGILKIDKKTLLQDIYKILAKLTDIELNSVFIELYGTYVYLIEKYDDLIDWE